MHPSAHQPRSKVTGLALKLGLVAIAMFGFGYAMVPLYDLLCDVTGINGKVRLEAAQPEARHIDLTRTIKMRLITINNEQMPMRLEAATPMLEVHLGKVYQVDYTITNPLNRDMVAQAIPSISPSNAADNLKKLQCFCFGNIKLKAGQSINASVVLYLDNELEENVQAVTLSYTLFDLTNQVQN